MDKINVASLIEKYGVTDNPRQVRLNHEDCPAGRDTRSRLYLTKVDRGWVAHCFNCGGSGAHFYSGYRSLKELTAEEVVEHGEGIVGTPRLADITDIQIKAWLYKYHIFEEDWELLGLKQTIPLGLYIPIDSSFVTVVTGFQIRPFTGVGGKYYTSMPDGCYGYWQSSCTGIHNKLVITEDVLSAYRVWRDVGVESIALLGTTLRPKGVDGLRRWASGAFTAYAWLDGDFPGRKASIDMVSRMASVPGAHTTIVSVDKSPKQYSPEELKEIAREYTMIR